MMTKEEYEKVVAQGIGQMTQEYKEVEGIPDTPPLAEVPPEEPLTEVPPEPPVPEPEA